MAGAAANRLCDLPGAQLTPACQLVDGAQAVGAVIDAASDPFGYMATSLQAAAAGLAGVVLPALESLTHPDLSAEWFVSAYSVSFALSIFVFVAFLGWNFLALARRRVSGDDVIETMTFYTPMFLGGVILGPIVGNAILGLTGALTDSLIGWGVAGSVGETTSALNEAIAAGEPAQIVGGSAVAIIVFACLIVALLLVFLVLLVLLVTLYLTGVLIPLSLVWLVHPRQRSKGLKLLMVWIGVCFSHVLLFLLLGVAFRMVGGLATEWDEPGLAILANLAVAVIALLLATLSPVALLKFAPVGPGGASTSGPSLGVPGRGASAGPSYPESSSDSQLGQMSRDSDGGADASADTDSAPTSSSGGLTGRLDSQQGSSTSSMESGGSGSSETAGAGAGDSAGATAGGAGEAASLSAGTTAAAGASAAVPAAGIAAAADSDSVPSAAGAGGGNSAEGSAPGPDPIGSAATAGGDSAESADTGAPAEGSGNATSGLAAAGGQAEEAGDKVTSAGQAAMASGAGAPVGLALMAAGQGIKAAGAATVKTAEMAQQAGDMAGEHMDDGADDSTSDKGA